MENVEKATHKLMIPLKEASELIIQGVNKNSNEEKETN